MLNEQNSGRTTSLAVPRRGHVLATAVETLGAPVRGVVAELSSQLSASARNTTRRLFRPRWEATDGRALQTSIDIDAWRLTAVWLVAQASGRIAPGAGFEPAIEWFCGGAVRPPKIPGANAETKRVEPQALVDLMPYILEPHGPGTRLSVMKAPETQKTRSHKRNAGIFYTPADVADFMLANILTSPLETTPILLDPACGTGVFLRAASKQLRRRFPHSSALDIGQRLFGIDMIRGRLTPPHLCCCLTR
jgi:hypothetical protein